MVENIAIRVEGLSKRYRIGERRESYETLRDILANSLKAPFARARAKSKQSAGSNSENENILWALKNVSLEIRRGEVVGVIGRNGAGKSTLLKILSRITEPTEGYAEIHGRVGSLLEVGTGFHQELTGRENVYLSGAILGMRRNEIEQKFDEIVDFAEVERFIDTPVKHYSSGMHLRLAFSVAAHLEPEILLVDEVLAVGDMKFQRKCLGKMDDVASRGRTVLFVSHNLGVVKELCQTSIVLKNGFVDFHGSVVEGLSRYSQNMVESEEVSDFNGTGWQGVRINGKPNGLTATVSTEHPLMVEVRLSLKDAFNNCALFLIMNDSIGNTVLHQHVRNDDVWSDQVKAGCYQIKVDLPTLWLAPGVYSLYFKFIGETVSGIEERFLSERAVVDVAGSVNGISRAYLAPPPTWTMSSATGGQ